MIPVDAEIEGMELVTFAKDQPEYIPLPARVDIKTGGSGSVVTCWKLSWRERFQVLLQGRFYLTILTFGRALQPVRLTLEKPEIE